MSFTKRLIYLTGCCTVALGLAFAQQVQPDNTKMNKGDSSKGSVTADQQKMNVSDRQLTQEVRKAVVSDKGLSTDAHNIKIITQNGKVTLKGPVRSEDEKQSIASKAEGIAGAGNIDNELTVKPAQPSK
jgi:hyperosmotically inducible periplasmic protein